MYICIIYHYNYVFLLFATIVYICHKMTTTDVICFMFSDNVFKIQYMFLNIPLVWYDVECVTAIVDEKTVDVKCKSNKDKVTHVRSNKDRVTHVRVLGPVTQRLCSLYIIGGNVTSVLSIYQWRQCCLCALCISTEVMSPLCSLYISRGYVSTEHSERSTQWNSDVDINMYSLIFQLLTAKHMGFHLNCIR